MDEKDLLEIPVEKKSVYNGKIINVRKDLIRYPSGGTGIREIVEHPGAVAIIAVDRGKVFFVKQYRYALQSVTWEIPAGKLDAGETPEACANRELREEIGYEADLEYWGKLYTSPGFSDEIIHLFGGKNLKWSPLHADEDEFLHVVKLPVSEALAMLNKNLLLDAKTVLGLLMAERKGFLC